MSYFGKKLKSFSIILKNNGHMQKMRLPDLVYTVNDEFQKNVKKVIVVFEKKNCFNF